MGGFVAARPEDQAYTPPSTPTTPTATPPPQLPSGAQGFVPARPEDQTFVPARPQDATPPPQPPSAWERAGDTVNRLANTVGDFSGPQAGAKVASGAVKSLEKGTGGLLNLIDKYVIAPNDAGATPATQTAHRYAKATADWLNQNTDTEGWEKAGDIGEQVWELLTLKKALTDAPEAIARYGPDAMSYGDHLAEMAKNAKILEGNQPLQHLVRMGRVATRAIGQAAGTAAEQGAQTFVHTGGDKTQTAEAATLAGVLHLGSLAALPPLEKYLGVLKDRAAQALEDLKPVPEPDYAPPEPKPQPSAPEPITPATRPEPPTPAPRPETPPPAAERFAAHERQAAQGMTAEQLEDLNKYRQVDESGTPTNIQQLGLPSQSATEPYQFRVPGWSATTEAGDLLHEAGARYKQVATEVVEGKGKGNMQPWEMRQTPFDLPRYAETPGAVVRQVDRAGNAIPPQPPQPFQPPRESSPLWAQPGPDNPPSSPFSHKQPIMEATQYQSAVRPGSNIRQATTIGGPSILTTDPEVAAGHLNRIENIVQDPNFGKLPPGAQADILQSHNEVMRQMQEYKNLQPQHEYSPYLHQPTFEPVDIDKALSRVGDMGDAADEMMRSPKEMYNQWENLTRDRPGGSFRQLNDEMNDLIGKTGQASRQRLAEVTQEMQQMFSGSDPYLGRAGTPTDLAMARNQFNNGYLVKRIDDGFTDAYKGANRTGNFDMGRLQRNWKSLVNEVGEARMTNTLGPQRFEGMNNIINDLAEEPAALKAAHDTADAADKAANTAHKEALAAADAEDKAAIGDAKDAAKQKHLDALDDWKQREAERKQANSDLQDAYEKQVADRSAALNPKQKWYYDLAKNGWSHMASQVGMGEIASIPPKGLTRAISAKVGAALVLKRIVTDPRIAGLAYHAAQAGSRPELYGPVIADMIKTLHQQPPDQPQEQP